MWVYDEDVGMNCREVTFVPGLYKIFDEILGKYFSNNNTALALWSTHFSEHSQSTLICN